MLIKVATYNIHGWVGSDGKSNPERICAVIRELDTQVVGLQEVQFPVASSRQASEEVLWQQTGMFVAFGPTLDKTSGPFGNAILSKIPFAAVRLHELSYGNREPRGIIDVELDFQHVRLRILVTHLGLQGRERHWQVKQLLRVVDEGQQHPMLLMGDFNEWLFFSRAMRRMHQIVRPGPAPRSFPARFPLLPLDRIWARPKRILRSVAAHRSVLARDASDHLPVIAEINLTEADRPTT